MPVNLKGRSVLSLDSFSPEEIRFLLRLAAELKSAKMAGTERQRLVRRNIALIFEKDSTRTRTGFEIAAYDQGAHVTYIGPAGSHIGHKESVRDTARVLGRLYDGIEYRGDEPEKAEELARFAGVPVYNGLTSDDHPTQILADFLTMREFTHLHLSDLTVTFMGDIRNNVARALALGAMKIGMNMRLCGPEPLQPDALFIYRLNEIGCQTGATLALTTDVTEGVRGCDFIYTDVWLSMGEPKELWKERIELLSPYRVTPQVMYQSGKPHTKFMHCLPAFHNAETTAAMEIATEFDIDEMEVSDAVFESKASVVFDQAENRMHTIKALLVATIDG
ncbi:MAG: ornithine carbamoyltransferase [Parvibaculaceae bacterium]